VPPPRRAHGANAFLIRVSFAGSAGLLIKQKSAAQGNIEDTSGRLADATNRDIAFPEPAWCPAAEVRYTSQQLLTRTSKARGHWQIYDPDAVSI